MIKEEVLKLFPHIVELRRYFHKYPEIAKNEYNTAKKIEEELISIGLNPIRVGETGVYAEIICKNPGKTIVLRADIDALPINEETNLEFKSQIQNVMHACGHDIHTASLLGAARILYNHKDELNGVIRLTFQQAEEIGYGAKIFINEGYLEGADRCYGLHIASNLKCGTIACVTGANNASVDWLKITVKGKASHISTPEGGIDALLVLSKIVCEVKSLANNDKLLIGIGKMEAGTAYNIVAEDAYLEGTIRAFDPNIRKEVKEQIVTIANNIASSYNALVNVEYKDYTSPLINEEVSNNEAIEVATNLFGSENVITERKPLLSGDDFAEYILCVPGTYSYIGTHNDEDEDTKLPHHNSKLVIDEESLIVGTSMYVGYTMNYLSK
jgi:amidohydrolase